MLAWVILRGLAVAGWVSAGPSERTVELVGLPLQQWFMMLGAVRRAWRVGDGDLRAGLGWRPVRRWRVLGILLGCVVLAVVAQAALAAVLPEAEAFLRQAEAWQDAMLEGRSAIWSLWVVAIGAPVAEELFFRGWLWEGLRPRWGAWGTGIATGLLFLLIHWAGGEWRLLPALVPMAIMLSVAREVCGSVRASIVVHAFNNGLAMLALLGEALG